MNDTHNTSAPVAGSHEPAKLPMAVAETLGELEINNLKRATNRVYDFRMRHPYIYAGIAFVMGGLLVVVFAGSTFLRSMYASQNLTIVFHDLLAGGIGGGIVAVLLAFAYTSAIRPTLEPIRKMSGVTAAGK